MAAEGNWTTSTFDQVQVGDQVRLGSGVELIVSRIDRPFFGVPDMLKLVEATDERWLAYAGPASLELEVFNAVGPV